MATPRVQYLREVVEPQLTETSALLPANLLVPSIILKTQNRGDHHPLEEHILRRPGQPNQHTYKIPFMDCEIHTFIKNLGVKSYSLRQTCVPTHGKCLDTVELVALDMKELPLTRPVTGAPDDCKGFDILDAASTSSEVLLELRFLYAPMPALVSTESEHKNLVKWRKGMDLSRHDPAAVPKQQPADDSLFDHSPNEAPARRSWFSWGKKTTTPEASTSSTSTPCDVITENADTQHAAVLAQMRAMLLA